MRTLIQARPVAGFLFITFACTWICWLLPVWFPLSKDVAFALMLLGGCGPLLGGLTILLLRSHAPVRISNVPVFVAVLTGAAVVLLFRLYLTDKGLADANQKIPQLQEVGPAAWLILTITFALLAVTASQAGNRQLNGNYLTSYLLQPSKLYWYVFALLFYILLNIGSYYIGKLLQLETTDYMMKADAIWLVGFFSTFFFFGGNEEFGWRGFLQQELQYRFNPLITSLIISLCWSIWHLPLHYNGFYSTGGFIDILPRLIWTIPLTIVFTWLYNASGYSLLAVILLHAMLNNSPKAFGYSITVNAVMALLFCIFCIIQGRMWKRHIVVPSGTPAAA